jgi:Ca2+/H+ antiporter
MANMKAIIKTTFQLLALIAPFVIFVAILLRENLSYNQALWSVIALFISLIISNIIATYA